MSPLVTSRNVDVTDAIARAKIHVVSGADSILRLQPVLNGLSARCGQLGVMDDIGYFLKKPGILRRVPHLLLISKSPKLDLQKLTANDLHDDLHDGLHDALLDDLLGNLLGAALLYKYKVFGIGIGTYTTNDRSGRGSLLAPAGLRPALAEMVSRKLMDKGALAVLISFRDGCPNDAYAANDAPATNNARAQNDTRAQNDARVVNDARVAANEAAALNNGYLSPVSVTDDKTTRWAWRERDIPDYLPLEDTFDKTLAGIGQRTRRNIRYYRKRAQSELGCEFVPAVHIDRREFLQFNRDCMYAVPGRIALWRYDSLKDIQTPLFMGLRDRAGRWLSLLGGRRHHAATEILWQMNRDGLSVYSLSLVMRAYFMEHEIAQGMTRLYMEGGTAHPMRFSFINDKVTDLVVMRRSWPALLVRRLAKHLVKRDNELAVMLLDQSLYGDPLAQPPAFHSPEEEAH